MDIDIDFLNQAGV